MASDIEKLKDMHKAIAARDQYEQWAMNSAIAPERRLPTHMVIVAGNNQQAEQHVRYLQISPFDVTIAENVDRLLGLKKAYDVAFVGSWYRRHDAIDILHRLEADIVARKLQDDSEDGAFASPANPVQALPNVLPNVLRATKSAGLIP